MRQFYPGSLPGGRMTEAAELGLNVIAEDDEIPAEFTVMFSTGHSRRFRLL
jgi:hypothetical protein